MAKRQLKVHPDIKEAVVVGHDLRARYYMALNRIGLLSEHYVIREHYVQLAAATGVMQLCVTRLLVASLSHAKCMRRKAREQLMATLPRWEAFVEALEESIMPQERFDRATRHWVEELPLACMVAKA